jgi:hypothetical protein
MAKSFLMAEVEHVIDLVTGSTTEAEEGRSSVISLPAKYVPAHLFLFLFFSLSQLQSINRPTQFL